MDSKTMTESSVGKNTKIMGNGLQNEIKNGAEMRPGVIFGASKIWSDFGGVGAEAKSK